MLIGRNAFSSLACWNAYLFFQWCGFELQRFVEILLWHEMQKKYITHNGGLKKVSICVRVVHYSSNHVPFTTSHILIAISFLSAYLCSVSHHRKPSNFPLHIIYLYKLLQHVYDHGCHITQYLSFLMHVGSIHSEKTIQSAHT